MEEKIKDTNSENNPVGLQPNQPEILQNNLNQKKQKKFKKALPDLNSKLDEFKITPANPEDDAIDLAKKAYLKKIKGQQHQEFLDFLKVVAPGSPLRTAIDGILRARTGALIVVGDNKNVQNIIEGGFRVNCKFTPQRLAELSKMDGAVIISKDLSRIAHANTQLVPDHTIPTKETGTRHKAAERTAKQINNPVIAISQKKRTISLYFGDIKYVLRNTYELLGRASENIQIIEKQRILFNELLTNLNVLEFTNLVGVSDIATTIQRAEIILKLASTIKRYIIELGVEGNLTKMQLRELIKDVEKEELLILRDYTKESQKVKKALSMKTFEELLESSNITKILSEFLPHENAIESSIEGRFVPKGYRILNKTSFTEKNIDEIINKVKNLQQLIEQSPEQLSELLGDRRAKTIQKEILGLKEQVILGKKI